MQIVLRDFEVVPTPDRLLHAGKKNLVYERRKSGSFLENEGQFVTRYLKRAKQDKHVIRIYAVAFEPRECTCERFVRFSWCVHCIEIVTIKFLYRAERKIKSGTENNCFLCTVFIKKRWEKSCCEFRKCE